MMPGCDGCMQVPVLYDKELQKIVSNESSDILRMLITEMRVGVCWQSSHTS